MKVMNLLYSALSMFGFVLSMIGCSFDGSTMITHTFGDRSEEIDSVVRTRDGAARFDCRRSGSGQCHYTLFPRECTSASDSTITPDRDCLSRPITRFALEDGESRRLPAPQPFRVCVTTRDETLGPDCKTPAPIAVATATR